MEQHESKSGGDEINTSGGAATSGNVDAGRDFVGRDSAGNVVNQYFPPSPGPPRPGALMADAASELWKAIAELNQIMGGLTSNVAANTRATERQAASIDSLTRTTQQQGDRAEAQFKEFATQISSLQRIALALRAMGIQVPDEPAAPVPVRQSPWWQPYATPTLLAAILIVLILGLGAFGGGP